MFIAYVKGQGEGCDYTIGCNRTLWRLKAKKYDKAIKELKEKIFDNNTLKSVCLFEIKKEYIVPIKDWYEEAEIIENEIIENEKINKEKEEYKRLKAKFK